MRPEFGCAVNDYVFAPADAGTAGQLAYEVRLALERWEPRIEVTEIVVRFDEADDGVLYIDIGYTVRGSNDPRNLVFPFYVIPQHAESAEAAERRPETREPAREPRPYGGRRRTPGRPARDPGPQGRDARRGGRRVSPARTAVTHDEEEARA